MRLGRFVLTVLVLFVRTSVFAQEQKPGAKLSLHDRVWIATQIYSAINTYFGHWRAVPDLDLDKEFQTYLDQITATDDRRAFDLACMELIAKLKNGHSGFRDNWLMDQYGEMLEFYAYPVDGSWVVERSSIADLARGDVITRINQQGFEEFFRSVRKYLTASNELEAHRSLFNRPYLFPGSFVVELANGRKVRITRKGFPEPERYQVTVQANGGTAYIRIPSFSDPRLEQSALQAVEKFKSAKAIIIDVRGNSGGTSPETLVDKLMNRRYRWWSESILLNMGLLKFQGVLGEHSDVLSYGGPRDPDKGAYQCALYIIVDGGCGSACEDFLIPFKDNHRAVIVGETTSGSTGQPVPIDFGNGMFLSIGARRVFFPDGSQFEGIGVVPDVEVHMTAEDMRMGRDPVLAKAHALIEQQSGKK